MGLLRPDAGEIQVLGRPWSDPARRDRVGYLPEQPYPYDYQTPQEYLDYVGRLFGLSARDRAERGRALLERVPRAGSRGACCRGPGARRRGQPSRVPNPRLAHVGAGHILPDAQTHCDRVPVLRGRTAPGRGAALPDPEAPHLHMEVLAAGLDAPGLRLRQPLGERWRLEVEERSLGWRPCGTREPSGPVQARLLRIIESHLLMQALPQAQGDRASAARLLGVLPPIAAVPASRSRPSLLTRIDAGDNFRRSL